MIDLTNLLVTANIKSALIVDDAYDQTPRAKDLWIDERDWVRFFEDITKEDEAVIRQLFLSYDDFRADDLKKNDVFVAALWDGQDKLRSEIIEPLFARYKKDKAQDLAYLDNLTGCLEKYKIQCVCVGRAFEEKAATADLIVIDLFLGSTQDDEAIQSSVSGLSIVIRNRLANPPLVVLMSRSSRLEEKRKVFRDSSGLFESAFRIIRKAELSEEGKLERVLTRLAEHYPASLKLAAFLHAWQTGLGDACKRTADLIRTLDLADLAQIQQLLLTEEGEAPGSYLVDTFDLVLQHEIEREAAIIDAAHDLNGLDTDTYPPPYVMGSPDLQAMVYRSLFQNTERLRLTESAVVFGDILRRQRALVGSDACGPPVNACFNDIRYLDVLLVMTPACDLQRLEAKRVLLLKGSLEPLTPSNWNSKETSARTSVFETASGERFQIKWDLKHIETISHADLKCMLEVPDGFRVVARLRQAHALELQQKLLSSLGRVGLMAPMPATFPISIEACLLGLDEKLFKIPIPALTDNQGVCFIGRKDNKPAKSLVLCEDACEALCKAIQLINLETVHASSRDAILRLRKNGDLLALQKGVDLPNITDQSFQEISIRVTTPETQEQKRVICLIRRTGTWTGDTLNPSFVRKAGLVLVVSD